MGFRSVTRVAAFCLLGLCLVAPVMSQLIGGHTSQNAEEYRDDAEFAVSQLNMKTDVAGKPLKLFEIVSAKTQVVAGMNVHLELKVAASDNILQLYKTTIYHKLPGNPSNSPPRELTQYHLVETQGKVEDV